MSKNEKKKSLVHLQRNPENDGEVRLLYHRVVAPTKGVLGWAGGESLSFDLVFTGVESMAASDVLDLVKVKKQIRTLPLMSYHTIVCVGIICFVNCFVWVLLLVVLFCSALLYAIEVRPTFPCLLGLEVCCTMSGKSRCRPTTWEAPCVHKAERLLFLDSCRI